MEKEVTVNVLDISHLLSSNEDSLFNLILEAIDQIPLPKQNKIIYACGGWARDKLFFKKNGGKAH